MDKDLEEKLVDLPDALRARITGALLSRSQSEGWYLSQIITGPARSGKTALAFEYAEALAAAGLVKNTDPLLFQTASVPDHALPNSFHDVHDRVVIVDEPEKAHQGRLHALLFSAVENQGLIVVLTSCQPYESMLKTMPRSLQARLNSVVELNRSFTMPEIEEYHRNKDAAREAKRAQLKEQRLIEKWRQAKTIDVTVGRRTKAPRAARFTHKKGTAPTT